MDTIQIALDDLHINGSMAAPGYHKIMGKPGTGPEGIVIYMTQARRLFKITLENDGVAKSQVKKGKKAPELKTSDRWLKDYPALVILDPDGWDRSSVEGYTQSFYVERITRGEFRYRLGRSTLEGIAIAAGTGEPTLAELEELNGNNE